MAGVQIDGVNNKIDFDDDQDTSISANTDDTLVFEIAGATDFTMTANKFEVATGSVIDINGTELVLDADADTSITADTDDQIDFKIGGNDTHVFDANGHVVLKQFLDATTAGGRITGASNRGNVARINMYQSAGSADGGQIRLETADTSNSMTERMRIEKDGDVVIGATSTSSKLSVNQSANAIGIANIATNASHEHHMNYWQAARAGSTVFNFLICISNNDSSNDTELRIKGNGAVTSDSAYSSSGGDYAEMFEWKDGNTSSEDRAGYSIILDGDKIVKATDSDDASKILGVVSGNPSVIGDADIDKWNKKYLRDDFNRFIMEEYTVTTWTEKTYGDDDSSDPIKNVNYPSDSIPDDVTVPTADVKDSDGRVIKTKAVVVTTQEDSVTKLTRKKLNPDWDSSKTYIPREERKEWDIVGLMGKLRLRKGQPTGTNWIKMRDISDTVEEWLVR
jgi:hypothetical protein